MADYDRELIIDMLEKYLDVLAANTTDNAGHYPAGAVVEQIELLTSTPDSAAPDAGNVEKLARELLALGLDEYGHHTEAENVRKGIDLGEYEVDLFAIIAALSAPKQVVTGWSAEDACEQFIAAEVDSAPEALRRLGDWLCNVLDEDLQKSASGMVIGAMMECSAAIREVSSRSAPKQVGVIGSEELIAGLADTFNGDDLQLLASARALLDLDKSGSLVPHGIGGHARGIIETFIVRMAYAPQAAPVPVEGEGRKAIYQAYWTVEGVWEDLTREQFDALEDTEAVTRILYDVPPEQPAVGLEQFRLPVQSWIDRASEGMTHYMYPVSEDDRELLEQATSTAPRLGRGKVMGDLITLRCPDCGMTLQVERDDTDYPEAVVLEVRCDKCDDGDFAESVYLDADGNHITRDPDVTTPAAPPERDGDEL